MRPVSVRRSLRLGACVTAAAGLLTAGFVAPASAATSQTDQLWVAAPSELALPLGTDGGEPRSRTLAVGLYHDNGNFTVTDGKVTVDISGVADIAKVTWPRNCAPTGTTAVCDVPGIPLGGGDLGEQVPLTVRAADGAASGAQGRITYEATAVGGPDGTLTAPRDSFSTTLTVGSGPDLAIADIPRIEHATPGDTRTIPFKLTNNGNESAHGFTVKLMSTYGLRKLTEYDACTSTPRDGGDVSPISHTTCSFDRELAPGESFELPAPLRVELARHALNERLDISVEPGAGAQDLKSEDNYRSVLIDADNTADFSVTGAPVSGAAGETVTARVTFANNGPGWVGNLGSGDAVATLSLIVPKGTTVTGVPEGCEPRTLSGGFLSRPTGAPRYDCDLPYWVLENTKRSYDFSLRVDTVVPGATGSVSLLPPFGEKLPHDPNAANNTAVVTVN
ncbi:hypothetical protein [Streptomyces sp. NPDC003077]|uniref:hypothetical protein n=1 Tax=Streptomyces sp. NPDC003077 TaxID=3154443 RepID=UPI0033BD119C